MFRKLVRFKPSEMTRPLPCPAAAKSRRQPKPYKPKKMIKLETKTAVYTACNNGSSSIVTKDGELYMFGKDAIYSDSTCE